MTSAPDPSRPIRVPDEPIAPLGLERGGPRPSGGWRPSEDGLVEQALGIVRRRRWIVVQALIVVVAAATAFSLMQEKQYTASANLLFVDPTHGIVVGGADVDPTRQAATNAALIALPEVSVYASRAVDGRISASEIYDSVSVDAGADASDVAEISAVSTSPERAAEIANAYGAGYIAFRRDTDRRAIATSIAQLQRDLEALTPAEQSGPEGERLRAEITSLQAASARRTGGAELVQRASPPSSPSAPQTARNIVLAVIVGLLLGFLIAAFVDRLDRRLRTVEDFERIYGLPVLAEVPRNRRVAQGRMYADTDDPDAEPFRILRTNLRYVSFDQNLRSLLVVSPVRGDGKSTIARLLATTMAAMGDDVVLVEGDLHERRSNPAPSGLSTTLIGESLKHVLVSEPVAAHDGDVRHLTVLPAGPPPPNPSELLESDRMRELLHELEERFEFVIVDGPATSSVGDSLPLVPVVSGVLVVGGLGQTTAKAAVTLRQQLELLKSRSVGLVVNYAPAPPNGYGYRN